jgi:hypothetical protein
MMTTTRFIALSLGAFGLGMIYSYLMIKNQQTETKRVKHSEYESNTNNCKMKVSEHQTWYGDTMVVTIDTTRYNLK